MPSNASLRPGRRPRADGPGLYLRGLRLRRAAVAMSAPELRSALGDAGLSVSVDAIYDWEHARSRATTRVARAVARALGCSIAELQRGTTRR